MRRLLLPLNLLLWSAAMGCGASMRLVLTEQTAQYTRCDHVVVECVDDSCSNVAGGPWMATACGTRYRCTNTGGHVVCVPQ